MRISRNSYHKGGRVGVNGEVASVMILVWIGVIVVSILLGHWFMAICSLIAMAFFVKGQAQ